MISKCLILAVIVVVTIAHPPLDHGHHAPHPYKFGYSIKDKHGEQHREESGTGGHVTGSYGFTDDRGIHRQVNYVADHGGFRAQVKTNEPGTANQNPAAVHIHSSAPAYDHLYGGYGYGGYGNDGAGFGYAGLNNAYSGYGGLGNSYGGYGLGYGAGYGGYGLSSALLGTLPYARYGY
ncbi:cuticle protein 14-like [Parasteatoda tepidariorum]|uniref:cuticle protein 14-like n=1 Tax=Parasteatoda tepidariorum TaxID=114398 RepID=UPI00077F818E|nr:glycine-rich cell wall structural protein-like [Parasteatoda tepidariorum]